jgi:hypothetical protein
LAGLAACGGGADESASPTTAIAPAATEATPATSPSTAPAIDTTVATLSAPPSAPVTDPATTLPAPEPTMFTGDSDSEWCVVAADVEAYGDEFDNIAFGDPEEVERAVSTMLSKMEAAERFAPPELADAVATSVAGVQALNEALAAIGYDFLNADLSTIDNAAMTEAGDLIDRYNVEVCGLDIDLSEDESSEDGFDPSAGTVREQITAQLVQLGFTDEEATCIVDQIDFSQVDELDEHAMLAAFDACEISLTRLGEISG